MVTALTQFHYFSPYHDVTCNLGVKTAHSPVNYNSERLNAKNLYINHFLHNLKQFQYFRPCCEVTSERGNMNLQIVPKPIQYMYSQTKKYNNNKTHSIYVFTKQEV